MLSSQVQRCSEPLDAQAVGNALYGLQGMSSDNEDVRLLVRALSGQVQRCSEPLNAQAVSNALYGLLSICKFVPRSSYLEKVAEAFLKATFLSGIECKCEESRTR